MNVTILGATGGLGRNVVDAALARGHTVRALVRDPSKAKLPAEVTVVRGDATDPEQVREASEADVVFFCVNPPFSDWARSFPPLLEAALSAARATGARLIFPGNVWIYGKGEAGLRIDEARAPTPSSQRGKLRAAMEATLFASGVDVRLVRLPEFYGPSVLTLTAHLFRAVVEKRRALWPGPLERELEFVFMPDAAKVLVTVAELGAAAPLRLHLPGVRSTVRGFVEQLSLTSGEKVRVLGVPAWALSIAALFDASARGAQDIRHLLTDPVLLDGGLAERTLGSIPRTPLAEAIAQTWAWHRARPELRLQG